MSWAIKAAEGGSTGKALLALWRAQLRCLKSKPGLVAWLYRTMPSTWTQLCHCINVDRGLLKVKNEELRNYCWQTHTCTGNLFLAIFFAFIKFYNVFIFCQTPSQVGVKLPPPQMAQSSNSITQRQKNHLLHKFSFPL